MTPVNNKSMIAFLFNQMEKLDNGDIDNQTAREQANLAKQVNNGMKYELDRTRLQMDLAEHNKKNDETVELRNIESKNFE